MSRASVKNVAGKEEEACGDLVATVFTLHVGTQGSIFPRNSAPVVSGPQKGRPRGRLAPGRGRGNIL